MAVLVAGSAMASAQGILGVRASLGYGWSGRFESNRLDSISFNGPELSLEFPMLRIPLVADLSFGASAFLGGRLISGGDNDGDVIKLLVNARTRTIPSTSLYGIVGLGYGFSVDRGSQFNESNGLVARFGLGYGLGPTFLGGRAGIETYYVAGPNGQLRGYFFALTATL